MRGWASAALPPCLIGLRLIGLCLIATACGDTTAASEGALRPSGRLPGRAAATVAAPPPTSRTDVLTGYRRFHQVVEVALATGDASRVEEVAAGREAAFLQDEIAQDQRAGIVRRGHAVPHPHLADFQPSTAQIVDCMLAAGPYIFRRATGERVGTAPKPRRYLVYATLTQADGTWKVAALASPKDSRC